MDLLKSIAHFPAFCGEVPEGSVETIDRICAREMALFFTFVLQAEKTSTICDDLQDYSNACYESSEFITRIGKTLDEDSQCIAEGCSAYNDDPILTQYDIANSYFGRGLGSQKLVG